MGGEGSGDKIDAMADRRVDLDSDEVPASIRAEVLDLISPGDTLWRCPRLTGKSEGWFGQGQPEVAIEWWLTDANGDLIEVFWED